MNSACNWDTTVMLITIIVSAFMLFLTGSFFIKFLSYWKLKKLFPALLVLFFSIISFFSVSITAFHLPLKISVSNKQLSINRLKGNIIIPVENIKEIKICDKLDTKNSTRIFGSGGFFGYLGKFKSPKLGNYKMCVTNSSKKVLVKTDHETFIISCNEPEELVSYLKTNY